MLGGWKARMPGCLSLPKSPTGCWKVGRMAGKRLKALQKVAVDDL